MSAEFDMRLKTALAGSTEDRAIGACPSAEQLARYLDRCLEAEERRTLEAHLASCGDCRRTLVAASAAVHPAVKSPACAETETPRRAMERLERKLREAEVRLGIEGDTPHGPYRKGPKVMVVDDDQAYLEALVDRLQEDYVTISCRNGYEALEKMSTEVDTVVLDIKMPGMSGLDVAEHLARSNYDCKLIFNTGHPGEFARSEIEKRFKPFAYVTKDHSRRLMACIHDAATSPRDVSARF